MCSCVFSLIASANEEEKMVSDHFSKLNANDDAYCPPSRMTCAYVAMSLLLSFYDSYCSDNFVHPITDENGNVYNLDWNAGSYSSTDNNVEITFNANDEYNHWYRWYSDQNNIHNDSFDVYSLANQNSYLETYLISIGRYLQYHSNDTTIFFLWPSQIKSLLEYYLYVDCQFNSNQVSVHMLSEMDVGDSQLYNVMKQKITDGNPVIYCGGRFLEQEYPVGSIISEVVGAHAMIAYDVVGEGENEDILLHTGWTGGEYISVNTTAYKHFNYIIWIEINDDELTHTHSYKYIDSDVNTKTYCACEIYSTHKNHNSNHIYNINGLDSDTHFLRCHCGAKTNIEAHSLSYSYYTPTQHYKSCDNCAYMGAENHNFTIQSSGSASGHQLVCVCGETRTQAHYSHRYEIFNNSLHTVYCECGYMLGRESHQMVSTGLGGKCTHCDYTSKEIPGPGQIILGEEEEEPTTE